MIQASQIQQHMEVVGIKDEHLGKVDEIIGSEIKLTKSLGMGHHHAIPLSWVASVDDKVHLNVSADDAKKAWRELH
jgi:hypothetical protein